jgi:hypothetical protein
MRRRDVACNVKQFNMRRRDVACNVPTTTHLQNLFVLPVNNIE